MSRAPRPQRTIVQDMTDIVEKLLSRYDRLTNEKGLVTPLFRDDFEALRALHHRLLTMEAETAKTRRS